MHKNDRRYLLSRYGQPPKKICASASANTNSATASKICGDLRRGAGFALQTMTSGATTKLLVMSPNHQVIHIGKKPSQGAKRAKHKLVTPKVALTAVLSKAAQRTYRKIEPA